MCNKIENDYYNWFRTMYKIRKFEECLLSLFSENRLNGTTHTSIGQEADAVAVMSNVTEADFIFSNHRCHGHFIAYSDDIYTLLAEIMGKKDGMCEGRGGSQHICYKHFMTNGVQGGIVPNATGIAWAEKLKKQDSKAIAVAFIGDGTLGQGVVYESFNMATLYEIPILYVIEDNAYAMTTKTSEGVAGNIIARPEAFGIASSEITTNDVIELTNTMKKAFSYVRENRKPFCQVIHTYRLGPHSKGDDFRDENEIKQWQEKDPIILLEKHLEPSKVVVIKQQVEEEISRAIEYAEGAEYSDSEDIFGESISWGKNTESLLNHEKKKCLEGLNSGLDYVLSDMSSVVLLGEDIKDPYGGAFKVTRGLSEKYPDRVINTPISEAGFIGMSVGMAINGMKPIVEMMFGDFISLGFDQLLNHATKYNWLYANQVHVPMLVRVPSGGGRGYGATHSQSLEKYLIGIPNLRVFALSRLTDSSKLIYRIVNNMDSPTILVENKKMYGEKLYIEEDGRIDLFYIYESDTEYPVYKMKLSKDNSVDATIITYGESVDLAMNVAKKMLMEEEVLVDIIVNTSISPIDFDSVERYVGNAKNIITLEDGTLRNGWGSEVIAGLACRLKNRNYERVAALDNIIPCGTRLEEKVLPNEQNVVNALRRMII